MSERAPNGIIVLDKPPGLPSNAVLSRLKRLLGLSGRRGGKAGFLGTLDPLATGVLPVFVGKATRLIPLFEGLDKTYRVTLRLGQTTDTLDAEGRILAEMPLTGLSAGRVREVIDGFTGEMEQRVPEFSAVKIAGRPAYRLAREGQPVPPRVRRVRLSELAVDEVDLPWATFRVTCTAGTYVRALARDIGEALGVGAHVTALRRSGCGGLFSLENSYTLERIEEGIIRGDSGFLRNPADFLPQFQPLTVDDATERLLRDGQFIPLSSATARLTPAAKVKALRPCGTLVAIGDVVKTHNDGYGFQPSKVLL